MLCPSKALHVLQLAYASYAGRTSTPNLQRQTVKNAAERGRSPSALDTLIGTVSLDENQSSTQTHRWLAKPHKLTHPFPQDFGTNKRDGTLGGIRNPIAARKHLHSNTPSTARQTNASLSIPRLDSDGSHSSGSHSATSLFWTRSTKRAQKAAPAPKREDGHYIGTFSLSRYIRAMLFVPIVTVLSFCIIAAVASRLNNSRWSRSQHWGWLAYSWNAFVMCCILLIWCSKVRKPHMALEVVSFSYWPLILIGENASYYAARGELLTLTSIQRSQQTR